MMKWLNAKKKNGKHEMTHRRSDFGVRRHRWKIAVINKFKKLHDMMENFSGGPEDYILKSQKKIVKLNILKH